MSEVKNQVREALELASKELLIAQASLAEYANILSREPYEADRAYDAHTEVAAAIAAVVRSQALDELVAISQEAGLYDDPALSHPAPDVPGAEELTASENECAMWQGKSERLGEQLQQSERQCEDLQAELDAAREELDALTLEREEAREVVASLRAHIAEIGAGVQEARTIANRVEALAAALKEKP